MFKNITVPAILLLCIIPSTASASFKLPDTGQTKCYQAVDPYAEIPCAGTGQDGAYSINPMSYTDNGNGTVTDNNTGLVWQKQGDGSTHNWYQASGTYDASYNPSSQNVCGSLNLGGHTDWRLPTKKELMSIVDFGVPYPGPTINSAYFSNTKTNASFYWSSTTYAYYTGAAWDVYFDDGYFGSEVKGSYGYVRCVRGGQTVQTLTDNHNGTVTDNRTGLMWQQGEPGLMIWDSALSYCEGLSLGSQADWRLPNNKELESLTVDTKGVDTSFFPNAHPDKYWSSTSYAWYPGTAWSVYSDDGSGDESYKDFDSYVRCVRVNNTTVTITTPTSGASFSAGATIPLAATATAISPVSIIKVEFYNGSNLLGSDTTSPYNYIWSNVPTGTYSLTAKAYDSLGGSVSSSPVTVTLLPTHTNEILWRNPATGENYAWFLNGSTLVGSYQLLTIPAPWQIVGTGDFQGNGQQNILWRNPTTGENWVWYMNGTSFTGSVQLQTIPSPWQIVGVGDFSGDGKPDILWRNPSTGENWVWIMNGTTRASSIQLFTIPSPWQIVGVGDFSGDGKPDIIWRNPTTGENWVWYMNGTTFTGSAQLPSNTTANWNVVGVGDFNNDNYLDIVWRNSVTGNNTVWYMNGVTQTETANIQNVASPWSIQGVY